MSSPSSYKRRRSNIISVSHISSISDDAQRTLVDFEVYLEVSAWLAWYHVVTSQLLQLLPDVHTRLAACSDVDFLFMMRDTQFSAIHAARQFLDAYNNIQQKSETNDSAGNNDDDEFSMTNQSATTSLVGTVRSVESSAMSFLSSAYDVPQMASTSTASYLNNKDSYPLFARTAPTNQGDAAAMVLYLTELNVTHVGIFYIADGYGNDFHADLVREFAPWNVTVLSIQYEDSAMEPAIQQFASSDFKYVIAILNPGTWRTFIRYAYEYKVIGQPDYFWMFGESSLEFTDPSFRLNCETEADLATAIHGSAVVSATEPLNDVFDQQLAHFSTNTTMQQLYIDQHVEPSLFENYTFSMPGPSLYQYLTYDAVLALMLATCDVEQGNEVGSYNQTSIGRVIYEQLLRTEFQGVSGYVSFDSVTGTRQSKSILYGVRNVLLLSGNMSSTDDYQFRSDLSSIIHLEDDNKHVDVQIPFVYFSNDTSPPLPLPPVETHLNLIPTSILAFGWSLCGFVIFVSLFWMIWTFKNRNKDVVKASQPIFLCQLCVGTILIASAIVPMSLQEPIPDRGLDIACMATPWLISMGFVTIFSALFTKTWRLNKLFHNSRNFRRIVVRPRDVVLPLVILLIVNFAVMLAWTLDAPLIWERNDVANFDTFGRSIESVGRCVPSRDGRTNVYLGLIVAIDLSLLIFSNYQAYLARVLPTEFSESTYIAMAMASMLEICVLGIPLLFLISTDPSVAFVIRSLLASVTNLSILVPIFIPKFIRRRTRQRLSSTHQRLSKTRQLSNGNAPRQSKVYITGLDIRSVNDVSDFLREDSAQLEGSGSSLSPSKSQRGNVKIVRHEAYFQDLLASENSKFIKYESQSRRRSEKKSAEHASENNMRMKQSSLPMSQSSVLRSDSESSHQNGRRNALDSLSDPPPFSGDDDNSSHHE